MSAVRFYRCDDGTWALEDNGFVTFLSPEHSARLDEHRQLTTLTATTDPLAMLEGWLTVQPSRTITGTERTNLLEDIAAACAEIRRLRRILDGEPEDN